MKYSERVRGYLKDGKKQVTCNTSCYHAELQEIYEGEKYIKYIYDIIKKL